MSRDTGMVLLETALAIPLLLVVAVALAWGLSLAGTAMSLGDAARQVARDVARGVPWSEAAGAAQSLAPAALIRVEDHGGSAVVVVEQSVSAPVPVLSGITVPISQRVTIPREWS